MSYSKYEYLLLERRGPVGWLINNRPEVLNAMNGAMREEFAGAWLELDADPEVKVIVHTGDGARVPDRCRRVRARHRRSRHGALPRIGREVGPALHRVAPTREQAGDHRGQRDLRRRRLPLGGRRRHRDRGEQCAVLRPARVRGPGRRDRGHRSAAQDAVRSGDADGAHRSLRAHVGAAGLRARHDLPDRRSAGEPARRGAEARRDDRPELAVGAMRATKRALWGALELGLTDACRAGAQELVSMWGHPDQEEGPLAFAEKREPKWEPLSAPATDSR